MVKTVHVIPKDGRWAVAREGRKTTRVHVFPTQRAAIRNARDVVRAEGSGQVVVHALDGRIIQSGTYGMPPIQDPPGRKSAKIEKAVEKFTRERLFGPDPLPPRA